MTTSSEKKRQNKRLEADSRPAEKYGHLVLLRADWRFLLPNPNPDKSICFADGMLAKAVETISNSTLQSDLQPPSDEHDLAVATDPDEKLLNVVFSALKPGGSCYIEWDVHTFFKPEAIGVKLEKAGFEMINFYVPKPDPAKAPSVIWIPLESYGAVSFLLKRAYHDKTYSAIKKIGNALRYFLWLLSPRLFINYPWLLSSGQTRFKVCSLARKPGNQSGKEAPFSVEERLGNIIRGYLNSNGDSEHGKITEILMLTAGSHRFNKVVLAVFEEKAYIPTIIVKIPRIDRSAHTLANEVKTLRTVHDEFKLTTGVPQVVFANHDLGYYAVGETFIEGVPLAKILKRNNCRELALKATSWLLELAKKSEIKLHNDWRNTLIKPLIQEFTARFGHSIDSGLIEQTNDVVSNFEIPCLICEHRDFSPWNIHVDSKGRLGVLDWESSRLSGLPALDLIYFITYLCFYVEDAWRLSNFKECYKTMLNSDTFTGSIFKECLNRYATTLGIPIKSLYPLRIVAWLTHMVSEFEHSAPDDRQTGQFETARKSLFLELWEEDILLSGEIEP
ncbi:MAG: aminoglycoside phosphotransferase family protein [Deltaproteobacteria bacterium]